MNKYVKLIIGAVALVALLVGSSVLYKNLAAGYKADNLKPIGAQGQFATDTDSLEETPESGQEQMPESETVSAPEETLEPTPEPTSETTPTPSQDPANNTDTNVNKAPDFTVYTAAGDEVHLSDFVGKPVVLNFWASWCGPCKSEMPLFQEMYDTYGEEIAFVVVNLTDGYSETVETAQAYIEEAGYTFPVYFDTEQDAAYTYYVMSIPTTYFIDAEGNLIAYGQGALSEESFKQGLSMLGF